MTITQISRCYWCGKTFPKDQMDAQVKKCKTECEHYRDKEHAERLNEKYLADRKAASEARHEKWDKEYLEAVMALPEWMPDDATAYFHAQGIAEFCRRVLNRDEVLERTRAGEKLQAVQILGYFEENDPTLAPIARCHPDDPELIKIRAHLAKSEKPKPKPTRMQKITHACQQAKDYAWPGCKFTCRGKPYVSSLEEFLGFDITAKERDAAWRKVK